MARQGDVRDLIFAQNAEPIPVLNIAFTTSAAATALPPGDLDGGPVLRSGSSVEGVDLLLQADTDCYVRFLDVAAPALGQVTAPTGANPGFIIKAGQTLAVCPKTSRAFISVKGAAASGNLTIFVSR